MNIVQLKPKNQIGTWEELAKPERDELWQAFRLYCEEYVIQLPPFNARAMFFFEAAEMLHIDPNKERQRWILLNQRLFAFGEQLVAIAEEQHKNTLEMHGIWDEYFPHQKAYGEAGTAYRRKALVDAEGGCKVIPMKEKNA